MAQQQRSGMRRRWRSASDTQVIYPWDRRGNTCPQRTGTELRNKCLQHRGEQPGSCKKKQKETEQSVSTPVSRCVPCVITVLVRRQSYCREKTALAICLYSTCSTPSFPSTPTARFLSAFPPQRLCLLVLQQQFPFPSSLLFPLPFFPSHWLGPLIVSGTCPQEP